MSGMRIPQALSEVARALEDARALGFLGPAPIELHVRHARGFVAALGAGQVESLLDLGCGAGVPGLVMAAMLPETSVVLLDANLRKTSYLTGVVQELGFGERVTVLRTRAELAGRLPEWRETIEVVVARSFGPPGATAECGSALVRVGGRMVVSEPPDPIQAADGDRIQSVSSERWPENGLGLLGLARGKLVVHEGFGYRNLEKRATIGERYPRRSGLPGQRPLF